MVQGVELDRSLYESFAVEPTIREQHRSWTPGKLPACIIHPKPYALHTAHCTLHTTTHYTLHTTHCTLHTTQYTLYSSQNRQGRAPERPLFDMRYSLSMREGCPWYSGNRCLLDPYKRIPPIAIFPRSSLSYEQSSVSSFCFLSAIWVSIL